MRPCLTAVLEEDKEKQSELFAKLPMNDDFVKQVMGALVNLGTFMKIVNDEKLMYKALLIQDTFESFYTVYQFDAKRWTNFMSRRPFSQIFLEIIKNERPPVSDQCSKSLLKKDGDFLKLFNENIYFADQLPNGFYLANYAEQFFGRTGKPLDLSKLLPCFPDSQQSSSLTTLLKNGILSTTMFSVMNLDATITGVSVTPSVKALIKQTLAPKYFEVVLSSVEQPKERSFVSVTEEITGVKIDAVKRFASAVDELSPPFLLDESDAMGRYTDGEKYSIEKFGSAIVEFRGVQQAKQLKSKRNSSGQAGFLTVPEFVEEETLNVFNLLSKLTLQLV